MTEEKYTKDDLISMFIDSFELSHHYVWVEVIEGVPVNGGPDILVKILKHSRNKYLDKKLTIGENITLNILNYKFFKIFDRTFAILHECFLILNQIGLDEPKTN